MYTHTKIFVYKCIYICKYIYNQLGPRRGPLSALARVSLLSPENTSAVGPFPLQPWALY
jgi:hypothetical protein